MAATQHTSTSATVLAGKPRIVYSGTAGGSTGRGKSFTVLRKDSHYIKHDANKHYRQHRLRLLHSHVNGLEPYCPGISIMILNHCEAISKRRWSHWSLGVYAHAFIENH